MAKLDAAETLAALLTESQRPELMGVDLASTAELVELMNADDTTVPAAVAAAAPAIVAAIDAIAERLARGGRLIYVGAGTAGRIGMLDAVECPPTFNTAPGEVVALLAGGVDAFKGAAEGAEDDVETAPRELDALALAEADVVVGITASGRTPYVLAGIERARRAGALTVGLACNPDALLSQAVDYPIEVVVGPEFISGSTRLKAGTAQKLVLNMISTITMVRLGKTYGNLMVDLQTTNEKLRVRAVRIVAHVAGATEEAASAALAAAGGDTRIAIVTLVREVDPDEARRRLDAHGRNLRRTLEAAE
jgi:N-acetylmuramic acid 6-phosphate etherase